MAIFPHKLLIPKNSNGHVVAVSRIGDTVNEIEIIPVTTLRFAPGEVLEWVPGSAVSKLLPKWQAVVLLRTRGACGKCERESQRALECRIEELDQKTIPMTLEQRIAAPGPKRILSLDGGGALSIPPVTKQNRHQ